MMQVALPDPIELPQVPSLADSSLSELSTGSKTVECAGGKFQLQRCRLTDGPRAGVEVLNVIAGETRASICLTRGMSLWKAHIDGIKLGWKSPIQGPIHPNFVALQEPNGLGWLDGFDELLVRCGMQSFGAPDFGDNGQLTFPLHGRAGNLPARNVRVQVDPEHSLLEVSGDVHETRFLQYNLQLRAKYTFALGQSDIAIHDVVTNASATPTTMQMLYHINVGQPLLEAGASLHVGAHRVVARNAHAADSLDQWAKYAAPQAGFEEQVYFMDSTPDEQGWAGAVLASADRSKGFSVSYRTDSLPYFTQWKNTVAEADGYVTGLEPGTGFPNPRSFEEEQGRLVKLEGGQKVEFQLKIAGHAGAANVASQIERVHQGASQVATEFDASWCLPRT